MANGTCSYPRCSELPRARGLCVTHYPLWRDARGPNGFPSVEFRFWLKVDKDAPIPDFAPHLGQCWTWSAGCYQDGYGFFNHTEGSRYAHRWSWEQINGPLPDGLQLDHLCRVRACVRPDHLEPVTNRENVLRGFSFMAEYARRTHCKRGHPFTDGTAYRQGNYRRCGVCHQAEKRRRQAAKRAASQ